jgi:hypothetical protein
MGREENVEREEYKTGWWEGASQERMLQLRKDQPTTYRVTLYSISGPSEKEVKEALDSVEREALVVELPPERPDFVDFEAHMVEIADHGHLVVKRLVGVGRASAGWESLAIFPPGEWKRCEAIKFREAEKGS